MRTISRVAVWLILAFALLPLRAAVSPGGDPGLTLQALTKRIPKYGKVEFEVHGANRSGDPFDPELKVDLEMTTPRGRRITVPGFWYEPYEWKRAAAETRERDWFYPAGAAIWRVRFSPEETGVYQAVAVVKDRKGVRSSSPLVFECTGSTNRGFIRVSGKDPRFFEFADGAPFFPIGQNLAFIGSQQYVTLSKAADIFGKLSENGANYVRVWTCCEDWAMAIEARKSAWGRSWAWRAPIVPLPDADGGSGRCLMLSRERAVLDVDPSHPVALRPGTSYVLSGRIRARGQGRVRLQTSHGEREILNGAEQDHWSAFRHEFRTGPSERWLQPFKVRLEGEGTAWLADLSLKESNGGSAELLWEADVNRPVRGFYNPLDSFMLDQLVAAAEQRGIYLQLCLLTRDLYMNALKDPASAEYRQAIADAKKFMRYAIARWGYSTSVAAWEYWNEMNPGLPTDGFYSALGEYLEAADPYKHLRTTSTWGPSVKDCRHIKLDFADVHFYLRPADKGRLRDEVAAVLERTHWLRQQAPDKPAHLGEFGLADDRWRITDEMKQSPELVDLHNGLWASALSGASGTAMAWWWERIDQRNGYAIYRPLSAFLRDIPWNSGRIEPLNATASDPALTLVGLRADKSAWLWIFHPDGAWSSIVTQHRPPGTVQEAHAEAERWPDGSYRVQWWDTRHGTRLRDEIIAAKEGKLSLDVPAFSRDIACHIRP